MKSVTLIVASMFLGLLAAGCAVATGSPDEESLGEAQQELPSSARFVTYYSTAAKTTEVGSCVYPSLCTGSTTTCSGVKTAYSTIEIDSCHP